MPNRATTSPSETQRFPKQIRITRRRDFVRTYETGEKFVSRYAVIFVAETTLGLRRLGITVTKKVGKANVRNKLKRWIREVYRSNYQAFPGPRTSVDLVVNVKRNAVNARFEEVSSDLLRAFHRVTSSQSLPRPHPISGGDAGSQKK